MADDQRPVQIGFDDLVSAVATAGRACELQAERVRLAHAEARAARVEAITNRPLVLVPYSELVALLAASAEAFWDAQAESAQDPEFDPSSLSEDDIEKVELPTGPNDAEIRRFADSLGAKPEAQQYPDLTDDVYWQLRERLRLA